MRRHALLLVGLLFTTMALCGCGSAVKGPRVKGKVTLDNKALASAWVTFEGPGGNSVMTNETGEFDLKGANPFEIIKPGEYNVVISKKVDKKGKVIDKEELVQLEAAGLATELVPAKYSSFETILRAKIVEGENTLPTFELKSK
jgi:hypothetical protein